MCRGERGSRELLLCLSVLQSKCAYSTGCLFCCDVSAADETTLSVSALFTCRAGLCGLGPGEGEQRQQRGRRRQDLLLLQRASAGAGLRHRAHRGQSGPCLQGNTSADSLW